MTREKSLLALRLATASVAVTFACLLPQCARAQTGTWVWTSASEYFVGTGRAVGGTLAQTIQGTNGAYAMITASTPGTTATSGSTSPTTTSILQVTAVADSQSSQSSAQVTVPNCGTEGQLSVGLKAGSGPPPSGITMTVNTTWTAAVSAAASYSSSGGVITPIGSAAATLNVTAGSAGSQPDGVTGIPGNSSESLPSGALEAASPRAYPPGQGSDIVNMVEEAPDTYGDTTYSQVAVLHQRSGSYAYNNGALVWGSNADQVTGSNVEIQTATLALYQYDYTHGGGIGMGNGCGVPTVSGNVSSSYGSGAGAQFIGVSTLTGTGS